MKIEAGKRYNRRDGEVSGVIEYMKNTSNSYIGHDFWADNCSYNVDGVYIDKHQVSPEDLISEHYDTVNELITDPIPDGPIYKFEGEANTGPPMGYEERCDRLDEHITNGDFTTDEGWTKDTLTEYGPWQSWHKGYVAPHGKAQIFKECGTINTDDALNLDWSQAIAYRVEKEPELITTHGFIGLDGIFWNTNIWAEDGCRAITITIQGDNISIEWSEE